MLNCCVVPFFFANEIQKIPSFSKVKLHATLKPRERAARSLPSTSPCGSAPRGVSWSSGYWESSAGSTPQSRLGPDEGQLGTRISPWNSHQHDYYVMIKIYHFFLICHIKASFPPDIQQPSTPWFRRIYTYIWHHTLECLIFAMTDCRLYCNRVHTHTIYIYI